MFIIILIFFHQQLQQSENMNILVAPGTYAVTAGAWGKDSQQTHVVRLDPGQSVNLDFNL